jgi:hypothetical protein
MSPASSPRRSRLVPMAGDASLGVSLLAGTVLSLVGFFHVLLGIVALAGDNEDVLVDTKYAFEMNVTAWGWLHIAVGLVAILVGVGIWMNQSWAYVLGLVVAFLSALGNFAFLPHAPVWSAVMLAFDVLVMWGLTAQLRDLD